MTAYFAYWAYFSANLRSILRYRVAAVAGFVTQVFWGLLRLSLFSAFYAALGPNERPPLTGPELTAYIWLGQALFVLLPLRPDPEALELVREGGLAYELTRPVDLYSFWFSRSVALRFAPVALRFPLVALFAFLVPSKAWSLSLPPSGAACAAFVVALAISFLLAGALTALLSVLCLWIEGGNGLAQLVAIFAWLSSGLVLPLPMMPPWLRRIAEWLPFSSILDSPLRLYSGQLSASHAGLPLLRALGWALVLIALGRLILSRSLSRVEVQGG